jgi:hypothetical protein
MELFLKKFSMKGFNSIFATLLFLLLPEGNLSAQKANTAKMPVELSIAPTASVSLAGSDIRLTFTTGKGAEQIITPSTAGKMWINYSSVVEGNSTNSICVSLSSGNLPAEVIIKLHVGNDVGAGSGEMGIPVSPVILSSYPQAIITNIGSCFTGQGINKGHSLTYSWELSPDYDPELLKVEDLKIEVGVTYTIVSGN